MSVSGNSQLSHMVLSVLVALTFRDVNGLCDVIQTAPELLFCRTRDRQAGWRGEASSVATVRDCISGSCVTCY